MRGIMIERIILLTCLFSSLVQGRDFYVNPARGSDADDGSVDRPWKSLTHVFEDRLIESQRWESLPYTPDRKLTAKHAGAPIKAGDTIRLYAGRYGDLVITEYYNSDFITITAAEGQAPQFQKIRLRSGSHWLLKGLHVSPEFGTGERPRTLVSIDSHDYSGPVHDIVVDGCVVSSAQDTSQWTAEDWNRLSCSGIDASGTRITVRNNRLKNVNFGISVSASDSLVENNVVENFAGDGLRGLGDRSIFQYNLVKNCYDVNDNHDDGFQSWSKKDGKVGDGEVVGVVLRGNTIIDYDDPNQPHRGTLQGIGCFDGMFVDWVIENNVVMVDHWHGITMLGAHGCRIVNNAVLDLNDDQPGPPWIMIDKHKKGTPSNDCTVRNNLTTALKVTDGDGMVIDHNLVVKDPRLFFKNVSQYNLRPIENSPAIDTGALELAPKTDMSGVTRPQGKAVDIGPFEYTGR